MKSRAARTIARACCLAGASTCALNASSYFLGTLSSACEWCNSLPAVAKERAIPFSFLPLAESIAQHAQRRVADILSVPLPVIPAEPLFAAEFTTAFSLSIHRLANDDAIEHWPIIDALRKWRQNPEIEGLSYNLSNSRSFFALDYSDIFETGRAPYRGSHGVSLFFRHAF